MTIGVSADSTAQTTSLELVPYTQTNVYIIATVDQGSVELLGWQGRLCCAVDNPGNGLFLFNMTLNPMEAFDIGSGLEHEVALGSCLEVSQAEPLLLATLSLMCDDTYTDGMIRLYGPGTDLSAEFATCANERLNAYDRSDLRVTSSTYSPNLGPKRSTTVRSDLPTSVPGLIAGIATVRSVRTPVYYKYSDLPATKAILEIEREITSTGARTVGVHVIGAVRGHADGMEIFTRDGETLPALKPGMAILFVAAPRGVERRNFSDSPEGGDPILHFVRVLEGSARTSTTKVYQQVSTTLPEDARSHLDPITGEYDARFVIDVLEPDSTSLGQYISRFEELYTNGNQR